MVAVATEGVGEFGVLVYSPFDCRLFCTIEHPECTFTPHQFTIVHFSTFVGKRYRRAGASTKQKAAESLIEDTKSAGP